MDFFDFTDPAIKAKELLIKNTKLNMVLSIIIGFILGVVSIIFIPGLGIIVAVLVIILSVLFAISIRNAAYYRLAILEACETIKKSSNC